MDRLLLSPGRVAAAERSKEVLGVGLRRGPRAARLQARRAGKTKNFAYDAADRLQS